MSREKLFCQILENSRVGIFRLSLNEGRVLEANLTMAKTFGYDRVESFLSEYKMADHWVNPEDQKRLQNALKEQGHVDAFETRFYRRDGQPIWVHFSATLTADKTCVEGIGLDITAKKQTEEQLINYRKFAESSSQGLGLCDLEGRITYTNPALVHMLEARDSEALTGKSILEFYPKDTRPRIRSAVIPDVLQHENLTTETTLLTRAGNEIPVLQSLFLIRDDQGEPSHIANIITDITERKRAEEALQLSHDELEKNVQDRTMDLARANLNLLKAQEELKAQNAEMEKLLQQISQNNTLLTTVFNAAPNIIFMTDPDGIIKTINNEIKKCFGLSPDKLMNKPIDHLIDKLEDRLEDFPKFKKQIKKLKKTPDIHDELDLQEWYGRGVKAKPPYQGLFASMAMAIIDETGENLGRLWILNDISHFKQADEQLHAILRASPIPTIITRIESGKIVYANQKLADLFGTDLKKMAGKRASNFYYHPEDRKRVVDRLKRDGRVEDLEVKMKRADGTPFWMIFSLVTTEIAGEKVILGGFYDNSKRKEAEEALRRERNFVSAILDTAGALVVVMDPRGHIIRFNRACETLTGYTLEEIQGKVVWDAFVAPGHIQKVKQDFKTLIQEHCTSHGEIPWITQKGDQRTIAWSNSTLINDNGQVEYVIAVGIDITQRKQYEEGMKLYRKIFDNSIEGIIVTDDQGVIIEQNEAHRKMSGFDSRLYPGIKIKAAQNKEKFIEALNVLKDQGQFKGDFASPDRSKNLEFSAFSIKNSEGDDTHYVTFIRDITERKQAEEMIATRLKYEECLSKISRTLLTQYDTEDDLQMSLWHLRDAAKVSRVYIYENFQDKKEGLCMRITQEVCATGIEPKLDDPACQHIPYAPNFARWEKKLASGEVLQGKARDFSQSGDNEDIATYKLVIPIWVNDEWYGFMGFDVVGEERIWNDEDIRTLRTASEMMGIYLSNRTIEEALRVSEERFRSLVENANDIIYSLDANGVMTYVSPKAYEILGYSDDDIQGQTFLPLLHPDDLKETEEWFRSGLKRESKYSAFEFRMRHEDGSYRWFAVSSSIIRNDADEIQEIIGVARDITEIRQMLEDLEEANRTLKETQTQLVQSEKMASLGMLVAGIAHEINTPIGAVASMHNTSIRAMKMLKDEMGIVCDKEQNENKKIRKAVGIIDEANGVIENGAQRIITIVRRLRSFARLDQAELQEADIHEGLEDTLVLIHHEIKHNITVVREYGDLPIISCYPGKLNQVFLNIFNNARQAITGKGEIRIKTERKGQTIHIRISDTGSGISPEHLKKIFDPGFTTKGVGVGTGLGLSIVYQIIQDHHGEIRAESQPGQGTTITIILPVDLKKRLDAAGEETSP